MLIVYALNTCLLKKQKPLCFKNVTKPILTIITHEAIPIILGLSSSHLKQILKMKTQFKFFAVLLMIPLFFLACSKDDDPADNDLFVGTYNGTISYNSGSTSIRTETGKVTVVKTGNNYDFKFSDGIPDINGVQFRKDENEAVSIGDDVSKYIKITAGSLDIAYTKDGAVWTANCDR